MSASLEDFVEEVRALDCIGTAADKLSDVIASQRDAEFLKALTWIAKQPRSLYDRLDAMQKLIRLPGPVRVSMRELTGWKLEQFNERI